MKFIICSDLPHLISLCFAWCGVLSCRWKFAQNWLIKPANKRIEFQMGMMLCCYKTEKDERNTMETRESKESQSEMRNDNSFQLTNIIKKHLIYFVEWKRNTPLEKANEIERDGKCKCNRFPYSASHCRNIYMKLSISFFQIIIFIYLLWLRQKENKYATMVSRWKAQRDNGTNNQIKRDKCDEKYYVENKNKTSTFESVCVWYKSIK